MKLKYIYIILIILMPGAFRAHSAEHATNGILNILGKDHNSREYKEFRDLWRLDKQNQSNTKGIKIFVNDWNEKVESILFAGDNYSSNGIPFSTYTSGLPFDISFNEDTSRLAKKLGAPEKLLGRNAYKFYQKNVAVEVAYTGGDNSKIYSVKYYLDQTYTAAAASRQEQGTHKPPVLLASINPVPETPPVAMEVKLPVETEVAVSNESSYSDFKKSIMDVFKAYKQSGLYSVKAESRNDHNYWNYKYTYKTKVKIPGEKFNMLYSFPFITSQLDFVSVLKEGDTFDNSFLQTYHQFEKKLRENFPAKDGWEVSSIPNKESKTVSDLEFRNDRYGAVVLDYCRNPKGKHIIYLRFLLFSN